MVLAVGLRSEWPCEEGEEEGDSRSQRDTVEDAAPVKRYRPSKRSMVRVLTPALCAHLTCSLSPSSVSPLSKDPSLLSLLLLLVTGSWRNLLPSNFTLGAAWIACRSCEVLVEAKA